MKKDEIIEKLHKAREADVILIHEYGMFRSKHSDDILFVLEGNEDYAFYSVMLKKSISKASVEKIQPYVLKGKDNVLKLNKELHANHQEYNKKTLFFM